MTTEEFTALSIEFEESDKASVYYAHLQNIFKELYCNHLQKDYQKEEPLFKAIDKVLYDVYAEHLKLQTSYHSLSGNLKNMLQECSDMINECKKDREELVKVTLDRQAILQKLKASTDQSLAIHRQNQTLLYQLDKMRELNSLFKQKNEVLEEQILNITTKSQSYEQVITISKEFERINNDNVSIQKDIADILKSTDVYSKASEPLQIMCLAFQEQPSLKEQLWDKVALKHKNKFGNLEQTKSNFFNFSYLNALMLYAE